MDPRLNKVRYEFIEAVKKMDPPDALVLHYLFGSEVAITDIRGGSAQFDVARTRSFGQLAVATGRSEDEIEVSIFHLCSLGFLDKPAHQQWYTNAFSREFVRACYPELSWR